MTFEEKRSHLTHNLLANGFFYYLCQPPNLWKTALTLQEDKIEQLCLSWESVVEHPEMVAHAGTTWRGLQSEERGISESVTNLYRLCWKKKHFRPKPGFPTSEEVNSWLEDIEVFINLVTSQSNGVPKVTVSNIRTFWRSGLKLYNFLQGISSGNPRFSEYFELIK